MDIPVKKLVRLMKPDQPDEVRAAAVLILGELGIKDGEAAAELVARLDDSASEVRIPAIQAVGKLRVAKGLKPLLERIKGGGEESSLAADAAAKLGAEGVKGLQSLMATVAPGLRRYIAAALTGAASGGAEAGVAVLLDKDPQVAIAAANAIVSRIPEMPADRRNDLVAELIAVTKDKKAKRPPASELAVVKVLTALNDPSAADVLWDRVLPPHPLELRAAALQAVGGWTPSPNKDQLRRLFTCAADADFRIAAPALMILSRLPNAQKHAEEWTGLLSAPDIAARRLAMDKVGQLDTAGVAAGMMAMLTHPDRGLRDTAREKLAKIEHGRTALADALIAAPTTEEMWPLARSVAPLVGSFPTKLRSTLLDTAARFVEAGDHRADPLLYALREADAAGIRDQLFDRAVTKRKKKDFETALRYLKLLARDPSVGLPVRMELAMVGVKISAKDVAADARASDRSLHQLENVVSQDPDEAFKSVEKAKWLDADDLFYIGFHFAEKFGRDREFGAAILKLVVKSSPRSKVAAAAKNKLKTVVTP